MALARWLVVSRGSKEKMNSEFILKIVSNRSGISNFHNYVVVVDVLQPCDPLVRVDRRDAGDEDEDQAHDRLYHPKAQ